ncbi:MAG TPA: cytochrome D1 domain-containing protein [Candidatus Eisenbacteria bacterium]|nr:cytochrome D1 domain-containing protein [Candidatus Eisenbacteria bacterium]
MGFTLVLAGLLASPMLNAQSTPAAALLALSKRDHTLAIVDPASLKVVAKVPVGNDPHEVIASSDGKTAYVSNYGFGAFNTLAVVDLVAQAPLPSVDLGALRGPHGLAFVGGKTWFTAERAKAIGSYDPAAQKVDWILGTGQDRTHMIWVSDDQQRIVTTNVSSGTVSIIEKSSARSPAGPPPGMPAGPNQAPPRPMAIPGGDWEETVVRVGDGSEGFDVSPDSKEIWVANARDGSISIIDLAAKKVTQTLAAGLRGANRLKFTPDGQHVFVSSLGGPDVAVFDVASRKEIKRITVGHGAAGIQMQPDGARVYVACTPDNNVAVIDLKSMDVVGRIDVGVEPDGLAWAVRP